MCLENWSSLTVTNLPVWVEHIWVCPHIGVIMDKINKQESHSSLLELDTIQHTVLIAQANKTAYHQKKNAD